ncbi:MAG: phosphoenolpyruvate carboxylase, partial [Candidatus Bathyarchaeia archaeon]
ETYVEVARPSALRVFIARSDPALNYGLFCAVLLSKLALSKLKSLEKERGVPVYPILGVGSMPFRGHLSPENLEGFLKEYRGLSTVTVQSALKYDYPLERTREVVSLLNNRLPYCEPTIIEPHEEKILLTVLSKFRRRYESMVEELAPLVNSVACYTPQRRARRLHIGLFGYSRSVRGVVLPRAIPFTAAFYSLGIPPEFIGGKVLCDLGEEECEVLEKLYVNLKNDLNTAGGYLSWRNLNMLMDTHQRIAQRAEMNGERLKNALVKLMEDLSVAEETIGIKLGPRNMTERRYENLSNNFLLSYVEQKDDEARKAYLEAARLRKCLG